MEINEYEKENRILYDLTPLDKDFYEIRTYEMLYKRWEDNDISPDLKELIEILETWKFKKEYAINLTFNESHSNKKFAWKTIKCKIFLKKYRWLWKLSY